MANNNQSNILLCGSSRVGKSTLINAICQQELAESNMSLNSVTNEVERYSLTYSHGEVNHETIIWDTPGIESWTEDHLCNYIQSLIEQTKPICMIYCASPGSFARLDCLVWLIKECHRLNIFCAFVCTNMWSGNNRKQIVEEFCRILNLVHPTIQPKQDEDDQIIYYDRIALATMVNSQHYSDVEYGVEKPPSGVEELIFGIAKSLDQELMFVWFRSVAQNKSFWTKMASKLSQLLRMPLKTFTSFCAFTNNFLDSFFSPSTKLYKAKQINHNKCLFNDVETVCILEKIYRNKLTFTIKSKDTKLISQLRLILSKLDANISDTHESSNDSKQFYVLTAEFENDERAKAIYDLWQLAKSTLTDSNTPNESNINEDIQASF